MKYKTSRLESLPWWLFVLFSGTIMIVIGIWVLITPSEAYFSLSVLLAIGILVAGVLNLFFSLYLRGNIRGWSWLLVGALMDIGVGIYLLYFPLLAIILLPFIIGMWLLFRGLTGIAASASSPTGPPDRWYISLLPGLLILMFSFLILQNPLTGILNIVSWMGLACIISGLLRIFLSIKFFQSRNLL